MKPFMMSHEHRDHIYHIYMDDYVLIVALELGYPDEFPASDEEFFDEKLYQEGEPCTGLLDYFKDNFDLKVNYESDLYPFLCDRNLGVYGAHKKVIKLLDDFGDLIEEIER